MAFYTRHEPRVEPLVMIKEDPPDSAAYAASQASTQPSTRVHSTVNGHDYDAVIGPALPPNGLQALRNGVHTSRLSPLYFLSAAAFFCMAAIIFKRSHAISIVLAAAAAAAAAVIKLCSGLVKMRVQHRQGNCWMIWMS